MDRAVAPAPAAVSEPAAPGFEFPVKQRCQGATRYGDPCRFWALADGGFCYWCEQAGRPRYPLPKLTGEEASNAAKKEIHKQRCQGRTVFGDQCRFWAAGTGDFCLWCLGANKAAGKPTEET